MNWGGDTELGAIAFDFLSTAGSCPDVRSLDERFVTVVKAFGFKTAIYLRLSEFGQPRAPHCIFGEDAPEWLDRYREKNYAFIDPALAAAFRSRQAFTWSQTDHPEAPKKVRDFWGEAHELWARDALVVPVRGPLGELSVVNLISDDELALHPDVRATLQALCSLYASVGETFCRGEQVELGGTVPALSRRELQCVFWMSLGKTDAESGKILGVSPQTVKGYIETAKRKLDVTSRPALTLRALALGLLLPDKASII
jgi:DNA-binding CsgD family transcriptional regulator